MSCYLIDCDKAVILAAYALQEHASTTAPRIEYVKHAAIDIWRTNVGAVTQRYPGKGDHTHKTRYPEMIWWNPSEFDVNPIRDGELIYALELNPLLVYQIGREARYQCSDLDDWETTDGGRIIRKAMDAAAETASSEYMDSLPGHRGGWADVTLHDTGRQILTLNRQGAIVRPDSPQEAPAPRGWEVVV